MFHQQPKGSNDTARNTCYAFAVVLDFVAVHAHLVTSNDRVESILLAKTCCNIRAELQANATLAGSTTLLFLRIRPQHFHHETSLSRLSLIMAIQLADIIQRHVIIGE